jgi:DNA polymerase-3 subunit epsilon
VIEIAMCVYQLETRQLKLRLVKRINPERSILAKAQAVHGIDISELTGCPKWSEVAPLIAKVLGYTDLAVAHNGDHFDLPFIAMELMRVGLPVPELRAFDTMMQGRWATPYGKVPTLGELCFACDVPYDPDKAHSAVYDVEVMMQAFFRALDWGAFRLELPALRAAA